jgi:flagellar assembly factor FliW
MLSSVALASRVTADVAIADESGRDAKPGLLTLDTRFGCMEVSRTHILNFPSGLLGFAQAKEFVLVELDNPKYRLFRILQCVSDQTLSFIVFPPNRDAGLIDNADIEAAASLLGIPLADLVVLLLVTIRRSEDRNALSVNLRAPVLVDASRFTGVQYVLPNDRYPVRFTL